MRLAEEHFLRRRSDTSMRCEPSTGVEMPQCLCATGASWLNRAPVVRSRLHSLAPLPGPTSRHVDLANVLQIFGSLSKTTPTFMVVLITQHTNRVYFSFIMVRVLRSHVTEFHNFFNEMIAGTWGEKAHKQDKSHYMTSDYQSGSSCEE